MEETQYVEYKRNREYIEIKIKDKYSFVYALNIALKHLQKTKKYITTSCYNQYLKQTPASLKKCLKFYEVVGLERKQVSLTDIRLFEEYFNVNINIFDFGQNNSCVYPINTNEQRQGDNIYLHLVDGHYNVIKSIDSFNKNLRMIVPNSTRITSAKHKTMENLLSQPIKTIIACAVREKNIDTQEYLYDWLFKNYYSKKKTYQSGNYLTNKIRILLNKPCFHYIMKNCFDIFDFSQVKSEIDILNEDCLKFINELCFIQPSLMGAFFDYLLRRILCEQKNIIFYDEQSERQCGDNNFLQDGDGNPVQLEIKSSECYMKTKDIILHRTEDILCEIFVISLSQAWGFGYLPHQNTVETIMNILKEHEDISNILVEPLRNLCLILSEEFDTDIYMNYDCEFHVSSSLPAVRGVCDLIFGDMVSDVKCTKGDESVYEILQLVGYASILQCNPKIDRKINKLSTINLVKGKMVSYDISSITKEQMTMYMVLLSELNSEKTASRNGSEKQDEKQLGTYISNPCSILHGDMKDKEFKHEVNGKNIRNKLRISEEKALERSALRIANGGKWILNM